jgi:heat-inducible transcriptional repressor
MADLEEAGFVASPHTSAGRVPTARGYRLFVDNLLTIHPPDEQKIAEIDDSLRTSQPQQLIATASRLLSQLTHFAGIVAVPHRATPKIHQIEFLRLSEKRVLLILISQDGDVENRILLLPQDYAVESLIEAGNYLNQHFSGLSLEHIHCRLREELQRLRSDLQTLMQVVLDTGSDVFADPETPCVISGEKNLLDTSDLASNMKQLRNLFELFEQRTALMSLLEHSCQADGIQIFIGGESGLRPLDECSVIAAPYEVDGQVVGSLGVIGPTRMAYERVIPIVDITARLLSSVLSSASRRSPE